MVWINADCINTPCPPGHFGGAKCVCPKCNPQICPACNEPIEENQSRILEIVNGYPRTIHRKCEENSK